MPSPGSCYISSPLAEWPGPGPWPLWACRRPPDRAGGTRGHSGQTKKQAWGGSSRVPPAVPSLLGLLTETHHPPHSRDLAEMPPPLLPSLPPHPASTAESRLSSPALPLCLLSQAHPVAAQIPLPPRNPTTSIVFSPLWLVGGFPHVLGAVPVSHACGRHCLPACGLSAFSVPLRCL